MLTETQQARWNFYQRAAKANVRSVALRALDAFLDSLDESPKEEWFPWARSLAEQIVDEGTAIPVRWPLITRAIVPALLAGYRARLPGCARWLASYWGELDRVKDGQTPLGDSERSELGLLLEALRQDPTDYRARRRLLKIRADRLAFSLHELPAGVLYGMNGATPAQCVELEEELDDFCRGLADAGEAEPYQDFIAKARFHFQTYREFLLSSDVSQGYAAYLDRNGKGRPAK